MFSPVLLQDVFRHMEWADARVWDAVRSTAAAESDVRLRELLCHTHLVQRSFLAIWRGDVPQFKKPGDFPSLAALETWAREYYPEAVQHLTAIADADLARVVTLPWSAMLAERLGRQPGDTTLGETAWQVASHTTYHRGQINVRLRELGGEPPLVDYIAWLWFGRPAASWAV